MNNKKIAIITYYYKNSNFGGNLQAYALPFFLNKNGFDAKQICYDVVDDRVNPSIVSTDNAGKLKKFLKPFKKEILNILYYKRIKSFTADSLKRYDAFKHFQLDITPHTEHEYTDATLKELNDKADYFITGSDQVFNLKGTKFGFWLSFAAKPKISYAASMALNEIPADRIEFARESLKDFKAIGVREERTQKLLSEILPQNIELNIDPTFLLTKDDWDSVASSRLTEERYVFCYFLGSNKAERKLAGEYAKKYNLKLVCIPSYKKRYSFPDIKFGDISLPYASPEDYISLIKYADIVFTDSFHACVFSLIYNKQFLVFNRDNTGTMSSRIISLMKLFYTENRFLSEESSCTIDIAEKVLNSPADYKSKEFDDLKKKSIEYIFNSLKD